MKAKKVYKVWGVALEESVKRGLQLLTKAEYKDLTESVKKLAKAAVEKKVKSMISDAVDAKMEEAER